MPPFVDRTAQLGRRRSIPRHQESSSAVLRRQATIFAGPRQSFRPSLVCSRIGEAGEPYTQRQPHTRRPRFHQQRWTRRRGRRRGPVPTQTWVFSIHASDAPGGCESSSGIPVAAIGVKASPAAAAPNKTPRTNARRSIVFIGVSSWREPTLFDYSIALI
jgi:hypothetical protein